MKKGYLSQYVESIAVKLLSQVETDPSVSNQHEYNGVGGLKKMFGQPSDKREYQTTFLYLTDDEDSIIIEKGKLTWYDTRQKARVERGVKRTEYRLYYTSSAVMGEAKENDLLIIAKLHNSDKVMAIVAESDTTAFNQMAWLFDTGLSIDKKFSTHDRFDGSHFQISFTSRLILERLGIEAESGEDHYCDIMTQKFPNGFPTTRVFSEFARNTLDNIDFRDGYDDALVTWLEREEILFKIYEKHLITNKLSQGFDDDVEGFIQFSLSVHNRRKSRAGLALENHLEYMFNELGIKYSRGAITENRSKPDFVFPGIEEYHDSNFATALLTVLGVKSSCKDRWRQVLSEAAKVETKHLLTLEAAISKSQTDEMLSHKLQLVIPYSLHNTYLEEQRKQLLDVQSFIEYVMDRQNR